MTPRQKRQVTAVWVAMIGVLVALVLLTRGRLPVAENSDASAHLVSKEVVELGQFECESGVLVASDPGYDLETVRRGNGVVLSGCARGLWKCASIVKHFDHGRITIPYTSELRAVHESILSQDSLEWIEEHTAIGVDAGQAGIFDLPRFRDDSIIPRDFQWKAFGGKMASPEEPWYSYCCEITMASQAGVLAGGVVSQAGKGDGAYACSVARNQHREIVGVWIMFVNDRGEG
jgi:hypothetical protein